MAEDLPGRPGSPWAPGQPSPPASHRSTANGYLASRQIVSAGTEVSRTQLRAVPLDLVDLAFAVALAGELEGEQPMSWSAPEGYVQVLHGHAPSWRSRHGA